jgi:hypothetical protein
MSAKGIDYFENSRRATYVQQEYAIQNPHGFKGYGENDLGNNRLRRTRSGNAHD